jgi:ABC-type lipoprotein export system ATPase subunit
MIKLRNVEKFFSHGVTKTYVLRRIDLDIQSGEFISIMGPSGAGKSTLLHIIGMHDQAWAGEYYFDDVAIHALNPRKRAEVRNRNIGFVFQSYHLLDDQTVAENLELPLSYRDVSKKDRQSIVCDTLDRFQIVGKKDLFPSQLSGGQQLTGRDCARCSCQSANDPADEPTGNLHSSQGQEIMEMFKRLNSEGTTIVQVTHSEVNAAYGNRIVRHEDGWIAKDRVLFPVVALTEDGKNN